MLLFFHYFLFQHDILRAFPATVTIALICLWKDIIFLINHAEKRLAKIEKAMYEDEDLINKRIADLMKALLDQAQIGVAWIGI